MAVQRGGSLSSGDLQVLHTLLAAHPEVRLALLYGSYAREAARPESDVDLAVLGEADLDIIDLSAALTRALGLDGHVISLRDPSIPLLEEILRDGRVVFERLPGAAASWRSRTLAMLETDRPWFARMREAWLQRVADRGP